MGDWGSNEYLVYLKLSTKKKYDILQAISASLSNLAIDFVFFIFIPSSLFLSFPLSWAWVFYFIAYGFQ